MALVVRAVEERDLPAVRKLHKQLFPVRYDEAFFLSLLSDEMLAVVAEQEGKLVGVATGLLKHKPTDLFGLGYGENFLVLFYLATFGVAPSHQRHGVGTLLLENFLVLITRVAKPDCVVLHAKTQNEAARNFYEARKFLEIRRKKEHYHIGGHAFDAVKFGIALTEKGKIFLNSKNSKNSNFAVSWWDAIYRWLCCPLDSDLIRDHKEK